MEFMEGGGDKRVAVETESVNPKIRIVFAF
jgi:hypothetical protein